MSKGIPSPEQPTKFELMLTKMSKEIGNVVPQGKTLELDGVTTAVTDVSKELAAELTFYTTARSNYLAWKQSVLDREQAAPRARALVDKVRKALVPVIGSQTTALAKLGLPEPKAKTPLTSEQKAAAAEKRLATREKLHTLGSRQKKALLAESSPAVTDTTVTTSPATQPANGVSKSAS